MGGCRHGLAAVMAAAVVVGMATGACGASSPRATTSATVPATVASTNPTDPYAVPATIDAAYLNRVFAALDHVEGDASRIIVAKRALVPDAAERLSAIYGSDQFTLQTNAWLDLVDRGLAGFRDPVGDRRTTATRILSLSTACIFVATSRDYSAVDASPPPPKVEFVSLRPADVAKDPSDLNPTPWIISWQGFNRDGTEPPNKCAD